MSYKRKYTPSKTARREFALKMQQIAKFCEENQIEQSASGDSYYFTLNGNKYRVSNHSVEASNRAAYNPITSEKRRELYHRSGRESDVVYIHASKLRIMEIYNDLKDGYELDGFGMRKTPTYEQGLTL